MEKEEIEAIIAEQDADPGRRVLQKRLAEEVTVMVHSREDYDMAVEASNILFGKSTKESLLKLDEQTLLDVFAGVPGGVSINKDKATAPDQLLTTADLLDGKYLLVQQGKKKYSLLIAK